MSEAGEQPVAKGSRLKAQLWLAAKIAVSLATLVIVFSIISPARLWTNIQGMKFGPFLLALAVVNLVQLAASFRTTQVARALGGSLGFMRSLELTYISIWMSQVLPSSFGGDVAKGAYLVKQLGARRTVHVVLIDRLAGVAVMLLAIAAFLPAYGRYFPAGSFLWFAAGVIGIILAGAAAVLLAARYGAASRIPGLADIGLLARDMLRMLRWPEGFHIGWTSVLTHVNGVLNYYLIGQALGIDAPFYDFWLIVPLIFIAALFPIAMAGWGVREASAIWLFGLAGVPPDQGLALSVSYGVFLIVTAIPGVFAMMFARYRSAPKPDVANTTPSASG